MFHEHFLSYPEDTDSHLLIPFQPLISMVTWIIDHRTDPNSTHSFSELPPN